MAADMNPVFLMLAGTKAATAAFFGGVGIDAAGWAARPGAANAAEPVPASRAAPTSATDTAVPRNRRGLCGDCCFMCLLPPRPWLRRQMRMGKSRSLVGPPV